MKFLTNLRLLIKNACGEFVSSNRNTDGFGRVFAIQS